MSFDTIWNSETQSFDKTKNLLDIDISWIIQNYDEVHNIQKMELVDSEDNKVTISTELQEYFLEEEWNKLEQFKKGLYEKLWLKTNLEENSEIEKFEKWFVDWLLIENMEMLDSLTDKSLDELVQMIKQLSNWDVIVAIVEDLYDSMWDILETFKEPYNWWLALWWFWLWVIWKWMKWLKFVEKLSWWEKLYEIKDYKFLENYKDVLWEDLKISDIVWEWNNAVILKHPWFDNKIIKVAKWWESDKLDLEYENHKDFRNKLREFKKIYKWKPEWKILDNFEIPLVSNYDWKTGIFEMEKVDWLSFKSIIHLDYYKKELSDLPGNFYNWKTDNEINLLLEKKGLQTHPWTKSKEDIIMDKMSNDEARDFFDLLNNLEWKWSNIEKTEINPFLEIFKKEWYYHKDEHWWNFMKTKDDKIYMIDFWRSEVPK